MLTWDGVGLGATLHRGSPFLELAWAHRSLHLSRETLGASMPTVAINDLLKIRVLCSDNEQIGENILWFRVVGPGSPDATDQDVATFLENLVASSYRAAMSPASWFRGVGCQIYRGVGLSPFAPEVNSNALAGVGLSGSNPLPRQVAGIISFYTAVPGRRGRGRLYMPFPYDTADTGDGVPSGTYVTNLSALLSIYASPITVVVSSRTCNLNMVIVHRKKPDPLSFILVTNGVARAKWATQRRRGSYGRPNTRPF